MIIRNIAIIILLILCKLTVYAQNNTQSDVVMFYNVENFFDTENDSLTQDDDFTPDGAYRWTWQRFIKKRNSIAKTIIAAGAGNAPILVGLCEVENYSVLRQLTEDTPLARIGYGIVHRNSPDLRGIDVALLYRTDHVKILYRSFYKVTLPSNEHPTRDILYAKVLYDRRDTLHILVNHWPSKLGGEQQSLPRRMAAAQRAKSITDSILQTSPVANIVLMGDFNDTPESIPLTKGLQALLQYGISSPDSLYNLMGQLARHGEGSLRYRGNWELIDQFIVSGNLLNPQATIQCLPDKVKIFKAPFLLENDNTYLGQKPFRAYQGPIYKGGISDHLPILLPLQRRSE